MRQIYESNEEQSQPVPSLPRHKISNANIYAHLRAPWVHSIMAPHTIISHRTIRIQGEIFSCSIIELCGWRNKTCASKWDGLKKKQEINSDRHLQASNEHPRKQHTILTGKLWCKLGFLLFYMFRLLTSHYMNLWQSLLKSKSPSGLFLSRGKANEEVLLGFNEKKYSKLICCANVVKSFLFFRCLSHHARSLSHKDLLSWCQTRATFLLELVTYLSDKTKPGLRLVLN